MSCLLHSNVSGFWRAKVNRYACLNTHMRTCVCAHLLSRHVCMCVHTSTHKYCMNMKIAHVNTRHAFKCVSPHLLSVRISTYLPIKLITRTPARLRHADKHSGVSQPINILKRMFHTGLSSRSWSSWTCPFVACEATVLYGNVNLCRSTFSIHSLSSLMLFHITPAVYGL